MQQVHKNAAYLFYDASSSRIYFICCKGSSLGYVLIYGVTHFRVFDVLTKTSITSLYLFIFFNGLENSMIITSLFNMSQIYLLLWCR